MTLADLLIPVAAAGVALLLLRIHLRELQGVPRLDRRFIRVGNVFRVWVIRSLPFLGMAGPSLLLLRLRRPRPSRRRIFRQPGTAACLALIVSGSLSVLTSATVVIAARPFGNPVTYCLDGLVRSGGSVLVVWLALALAGAWRPAPDWVDRSGRALGVVMIVLNFPWYSRTWWRW